MKKITCLSLFLYILSCTQFEASNSGKITSALIKFDTIDQYHHCITQNTDSSTLVVINLENVIVTVDRMTHHLPHQLKYFYTSGMLKQSTDLLNAKKAWNEVFNDIYSRKGDLAILFQYTGKLDYITQKLFYDITDRHKLHFNAPQKQFENVFFSPRNANIGLALKNTLEKYPDRKFKKIILVDSDENNLISAINNLSTSHTILPVHFTLIDEYFQRKIYYYFGTNELYQLLEMPFFKEYLKNLDEACIAYNILTHMGQKVTPEIRQELKTDDEIMTEIMRKYTNPFSNQKPTAAQIPAIITSQQVFIMPPPQQAISSEKIRL